MNSVNSGRVITSLLGSVLPSRALRATLLPGSRVVPSLEMTAKPDRKSPRMRAEHAPYRDSMNARPKNTRSTTGERSPQRCREHCEQARVAHKEERERGRTIKQNQMSAEHA